MLSPPHSSDWSQLLSTPSRCSPPSSTWVDWRDSCSQSVSASGSSFCPSSALGPFLFLAPSDSDLFLPGVLSASMVSGASLSSTILLFLLFLLLFLVWSEGSRWWSPSLSLLLLLDLLRLEGVASRHSSFPECRRRVPIWETCSSEPSPSACWHSVPALLLSSSPLPMSGRRPSVGSAPDVLLCAILARWSSSRAPSTAGRVDPPAPGADLGVVSPPPSQSLWAPCSCGSLSPRAGAALAPPDWCTPWLGDLPNLPPPGPGCSSLPSIGLTPASSPSVASRGVFETAAKALPPPGKRAFENPATSHWSRTPHCGFYLLRDSGLCLVCGLCFCSSDVSSYSFSPCPFHVGSHGLQLPCVATRPQQTLLESPPCADLSPCLRPLLKVGHLWSALWGPQLPLYPNLSAHRPLPHQGAWEQEAGLAPAPRLQV